MAETVQMPKLGFDMAEGVLVRWVKLEGDAVHKGEVLAEIETDKATVEVESQFDGQLLKHFVEQDSIVPVGAPIALIGEPGEKAEPSVEMKKEKLKEPEQPAMVQKDTAAETAVQHGATVMDGERIKVSPLARKIAEEKQIDLMKVSGSGPGGRIVRDDLEKVVNLSTAAMVKPLPVVQRSTVATDVKHADQKVPLNKLRQIIGRRMAESKQQIPHFYLTRAYSVDALMKMRSEANQILPAEEKLSINDFLVKAVALTLVEFPNLNAALVGNEIVQYGDINIGNAVAIGGGLMTVVTRNANLKSVRMISSETKGMIQRARDGKVHTEDIEGSTFSISNLGMYKIDHFSAIINPPEAAILAVGAAKQVPVVKDDQLGMAWEMNITISADHRVTDGAEAAEFMQRLEYYLSNPLTLFV
jgi:pyruvate dehydrogenase E2 component (dihydrolipoamide acetyltransferase)